MNHSRASRRRRVADDCVLVGSAIVKQVLLHPQNATTAVRNFTATLIAATKRSEASWRSHLEPAIRVELMTY